MTTWTATQLATFLNTAAGHELCPLFALMALTGLRRGEAIGLRWIDVDLEEGTVRVEQQIVAVAGERHTGPPKSAHGRRTLALPASLTTALQKHRGRQQSAQDSAGTGWVNTGLVFTTATGTALNPAYVSRQFDRLVTASGPPRIRLHGLRHTSASLGLASGESLLEVSRRLGHSSITITADVYSDVTPATARASAERLDTLIAGGSSTRPRH
jgi:integrase